MNLKVPLFSQRDPAWQNLKLGTSNTTIGDYGCLLTCLAMLAKYRGKDVSPKTLNVDFVLHNAYADGNLYKWYEGISKVYPDIKLTKLVDTPKNITTAQFNEMKAEIDKGNPVILQVDFYPATARPDMHFVLLIGYDDTNFYVADPFYGDIANLTRYGVPKVTILKYAFHDGVAPIVFDFTTDECKKRISILEMNLENKIDELKDIQESRDKWKKLAKKKEVIVMKDTRFTLTVTDKNKILRGALLAMGGALITYLLEVLPGIDFGANSVLIAAVISTVLNAIRKFISNTN